MKAFLITFKPSTESPDRGWSLEELQRLVRRRREGKRTIEPWRFNNRKDVSLGDRVFLLLQGKKGPAIIGYGNVAGEPDEKTEGRERPVEFERIVDPSIDVLANRDALRMIEGAQRFWKIQSSGVQLSGDVAGALESLIVSKVQVPLSDSSPGPDWCRDELILALDVYLKNRTHPPGKNSKEIRALSDVLRRLGAKLFPPQVRSSTFRNENGVYMKLMNFRRLDPLYTASGKKGLVRGAKADADVWAEFADDATRCALVAEAIRGRINDSEADPVWFDPEIGEYIQEATEGRLLTRKHIARERNRRLVESKRKQAMQRYGRLRCEGCSFDFAARYGDRGKHFIECHHTKPVSTFIDAHTTHLSDLALVCANCHRMIHQNSPWLSIAELKKIIHDAGSEL